MAKFELRFLCVSLDGAYIKIERFQDNDETVDEIIELTLVDELKVKRTILLDKSTAIKFAKTLRTEINKIV